MKYLKVLPILFLSFFVLIPVPTLAEETTVADVLGDEEIDTELIMELDEKEEEREEEFENQLLLSLPQQTDNPSYILTFTDPSEEKEGVQLEIDGEKYTEIESPYPLPALSIGNHTLKFKFTDNEGASQILEKELVVIPRPPVISAPIVGTENIQINGTTLANSEVVILITYAATNHTETVKSESDGTFSLTYIPEEMSEEIFNVSAYTRKYGYASDLSEVKSFGNGQDNSNTESNRDEQIVFSMAALADPQKVLDDSPEFVIYTVIVNILGILIGVMLLNLFKNNKESKKIKKIENEIKTKKTEGKEMTLREKLASEKEDSEKSKKKEPKKKEQPKTKKQVNSKTKTTKKKKETVVSKESFMKDFKSFDPDTKKGKERKVKVSLTSNQKE